MHRRAFLWGVGGMALSGCASALGNSVHGSRNDSLKSGLLPRPRVKAMGIGHAGRSILDSMIESRIPGVDEHIYIDTDAEDLELSMADLKIILGTGERQSDVSACRLALVESGQITTAIGDANVLLLISGMGGSTGAGIAPVVARLVRECRALTIALLVTPFSFEGRRQFKAARGVRVMQSLADCTKVYCNDASIHHPSRRITRLEAYATTDKAVIDDARAVLTLVTGTGAVLLRQQL